VFFTNLRRDGAAPAHINSLDTAGLAQNHDAFEKAIGYELGDLAHDEVDLLRPEVYNYLAARETEAVFCKVHDAYILLPNGQPLFPAQATAGAIYLIRNPLDVCVSYAHHSGARSCDEVIAWMADPHFVLAGGFNSMESQMRQQLLTWSGHVLSWVDAPDLRILVIRYEDMKARPVETFTKAAAFAGLTQDAAQIARAQEFSSLEELQRQEREHGFREALDGSRVFFRKGKVGSWREELTPSQVGRIIRDHRDVMLRFGYLNSAGEPIV
jgi:hypothetical protein